MEKIYSSFLKTKIARQVVLTSHDIAFDCYVQSSNESESSEYEEENIPRPTRKHSSSKLATDIVISTRVSTNKAFRIFKHLSDGGLATTSPSLSAILRATFKEAVKIKQQLKKDLQLENCSLHFDEKRIDKIEYQMMVLEQK